MSTKHTPEKWEYLPANLTKKGKGLVGYRNKFESFFSICEVSRSFPLDHNEAEANGWLIAAAPDMLACLQEAVNHSHVYDTNPALIELFTAIINKATNKKPLRNHDQTQN